MARLGAPSDKLTLSVSDLGVGFLQTLNAKVIKQIDEGSLA